MDTSGFQVLLARLPDDVRTKCCAQALQEELTDVQTRLSACSEAMAHAAQVEAAIASLEAANSDAAIRSSQLSAPLSELRALHLSFQQQMQSLLQPFDATQSTHKSTKTASDTAAAAPSSSSAAPDNEEDQQAQDVYAKQLKMLEKIERYATKRRRSTWLLDAVEHAREFASVNVTDDNAPHTKSLSKRQRKTWTNGVIRAMETLRTALLECAGDNIELLPRLVKALKRLAKHRTNFVDLYTESEQLLTAKEHEIAAKEKRRAEKAAAAAADKKQKKRKLSDASVASSTTSTRERKVVVVQTPVIPAPVPEPASSAPVAPAPAPEPALSAPVAPVAAPRPAPVPRLTKKLKTMTDIRTALTRCTREVKQLRVQFTPELFDATLTCAYDVAKKLSHGFTKDEVTALVSIVFTIFEQVERVTPASKCMSKLLRLEATMSRIITAKDIPISEKCRTMVREYRSNCQKVYTHVRKGRQASTLTFKPSASKRPAKPANAHLHFDD